MARRGRRPNVVTKLVVDYSNPESIANAIKAIEKMEHGLEKVEVEAGKLADHIQALFLNRMVVELAQYPPRQKGMKIRWKSPKQKIKVMILLRQQAEARLGRKLRKGDDISYVRTGAYAQGWITQAKVTTKGVRVEVENLAENEEGERYGKFVGGGIGLGISRTSIARYSKPIQPFHKDRGWKQVQPVIQRYMVVIVDYAGDEFERQIEAVAQRSISNA